MVSQTVGNHHPINGIMTNEWGNIRKNMGLSINGDIPKWMVYKGKSDNPICKWMI